MNDYNVSPEATALVNDSPFTPDSLAVAQYGLQYLRKYRVSLRANRVGGEFFSQFEGKFLFIESVDVPCTIHLGSASGNEVYCTDGYTFTGAFKGITLTHIDYSSIGTTSPLTITFYIGDSEEISNPLNRVTANRLSLPVIFNHTTGVAGNTSLRFPVPDGSRTVESASVYAQCTLTAAIAGDVVGELTFRVSAAGNACTVPIGSYYGSGYNSALFTTFRQKCSVSVYNAATFVYTFGCDFSSIPIPSWAREIEIRQYVNGVNNLSAVAGFVGGSVGGSASVFVS